MFGVGTATARIPLGDICTNSINPRIPLADIGTKPVYMNSPVKGVTHHLGQIRATSKRGDSVPAPKPRTSAGPSDNRRQAYLSNDPRAQIACDLRLGNIKPDFSNDAPKSRIQRPDLQAAPRLSQCFRAPNIVTPGRMSHIRSSSASAPSVAQCDGHIASAPSRPMSAAPATSGEVQRLLEEADISEQKQKSLKSIFDRFAQERDGKKVLALAQFYAFLDAFSLFESALQAGPFFHAFDRRKTGEYLTYEDFVVGCVAADMSTQHVVQRVTGKLRAGYILDFYDSNYSGKLEADEFRELLKDAKVIRGDDNGKSFRDFCKSEGLIPASGNEQRFSDIDRGQLLSLLVKNKIGSDLFRFQTDFLTLTDVSGLRRDCSEDTMRDDISAASPDLLMDDCALWKWWCPDFANLCALDAPTAPRHGTFQRAPSIPRAPSVTVELQRAYASAAYVTSTLMDSGDIDNEKFTLLQPDEIYNLCECVYQKLRAEPNVIEKKISSSFKIFGSLHGHLSDLLSYFHHFNKPFAQLGKGDLSYTHYIFMGDFVDFGPKSLEVVLLLFSLYLLHPTQVTLLRGVHEATHVNYVNGFREECIRRSNELVYSAICGVFDYLSFAAFLLPTSNGANKIQNGDKGGILCLPTGVPSCLKSLKTLDDFKKPNRIEATSASVTIEQQWTEISQEMFTFPPKPFLPSKALKRFCEENHVRTVIQSRFCPRHGAVVRENGRNVIVSSAVAHAGALLHLRQDAGLSAPMLMSRENSTTTCSLSRESSATSTFPLSSQARIAREISSFSSDGKDEMSHALRLQPQCLVAHPISKDMQERMRIGPVSISPRKENVHWVEHSKKECVVYTDTAISVEMASDHPAPALPLSTLKHAQVVCEREESLQPHATTCPSPCRRSQKEERTPISLRDSNSRLHVDIASSNPVGRIGIQILTEAQEMASLTSQQLRDTHNAKWLYNQWRGTPMGADAYFRALVKFKALAEQSHPDIVHRKQYITRPGLLLWVTSRLRKPVQDLAGWFNAFDFDQDGKISASDFLFGLLASSPKNSCATMRAIAIMRYYAPDASTGKNRQRVLALPRLEMDGFRRFVSDCNTTLQEAYPSGSFPMELETFTSLAVNTDSILNMPWD